MYLILYWGAPKTAGGESGNPAEDSINIFLIAFCLHVFMDMKIFSFSGATK